MGAFFSGQDDRMLQQEGNDTNCFVSLVVDTKGTYVARITRKVQTKSEVTVRNLGTSYEFFGEGTRQIREDNTEVTKTIDKEVIEYFDLEVTRQEVTNSLEYLDDRFNEIEARKGRRKNSFLFTPQDDFPLDKPVRELDLFGEEPRDGGKPFADVDAMELECRKTQTQWTPDKRKVHEAVVHIVTCSLILNPEKLDLKQWITRHMNNVYKRLFGEHSTEECGRNVSGPFSEWRDFIIQYSLDYFNDDTVPDELLDDYDFYTGMVAQSMLDELWQYKDITPYIKAYCDTLQCYL